jgi:IS30 family transposase
MSYTQLTLVERFVIYHMRVVGCGVRQIARELGRHHSTISRELERNTTAEGLSPMWISHAQRLCEQRRQRARHRRRADNAVLGRYVQERLSAHWSPQMIAGRLPVDFPGDTAMRISHEAVYRWIYAGAKLGGQLYRCLPYRRKRRRKQRRCSARCAPIAGRVPISQRPTEIDTRKHFGHWEADTIYGSKTKHCLLTHVERKTRFLILTKIEDRSASSVAQAHIAQFSQLPQQWRQSVTVDNGSEFAQFSRVEQACSLRFYFADPYCAWQRGSNENTNGLIRRYLPKGTDFSQVDDTYLAKLAENLNNRPRRCLNYRTPTELVTLSFSGALRS